MTATPPIRTPSATAASDAVLAHLDSRMAEVLENVEKTEFWHVLTSSDTDPQLIRLIMREIYLEIWSYQPQVIEGMMSIIARMPKKHPKLIRAMLLHVVDEADHGEMALRDYGRLGGDMHAARNVRPSPEAFAVASFWWGLCRMADPMAYLGAVYPFECMTPLVCAKVLEVLRQRGFPDDALEFIDFHAEEDIKHANLVRHMVEQAVQAFPESTEAILHGMECWFAVYPMPVWNAALRRATSEWASLQPA